MNTSQVQLIQNTKPAVEDCRWCGAGAGEAHSAFCHFGERSKQVQRLGGVAWPKDQPLLDRSDFLSDTDYQRFLSPVCSDCGAGLNLGEDDGCRT